MSEEQFTALVRWFETLSASIEKMRTSFDKSLGVLEEQVHEIRELLAHQQDDDRVQRHAIADVSRGVESLDRRVEALERRP